MIRIVPCIQECTETLTLVTINIEGFHGNQVYLQTLANGADILLLQEHWLHTFEKHKLDASKVS
jgi:hypothetical protein